MKAQLLFFLFLFINKLYGQFGIEIGSNIVFIRTEAFKIRNFDSYTVSKISYERNVLIGWNFKKISFISGLTSTKYNMNFSLTNNQLIPPAYSLPDLKGKFLVYQLPFYIKTEIYKSKKISFSPILGCALLFSNNANSNDFLLKTRVTNEVQIDNQYYLLSNYFTHSLGTSKMSLLFKSAIELKYNLSSKVYLKIIQSYQFGFRNLTNVALYYSYYNTQVKIGDSNRIILYTKGSGAGLGLSLGYSLGKMNKPK